MREVGQLAFIALGSNLGNSVQILKDAFTELQKLSKSPIVRSSLWRSSPVDCPPGSPTFYNAVAAISPFPQETPASLLTKLQALEKKFGRIPKLIHNEARPLDLDLLSFGQERLNSPQLTLPHPRAHLRQFVLRPWAEIAPEFVPPGFQRNVRDLLNTLRSDERLECLSD